MRGRSNYKTQQRNAAVFCFSMIMVLIFLAVTCNSCSAQYVSNVAEYRVYVYDTHDQQEPTYTHPADSNSFNLAWERGTGPGWLPPAHYEQIFFHVIPNTEEMWEDGTATAPFVISLVEGNYAFTLTEVDINNWESGRANPFFMRTLAVFARVPFSYRIPQ